MQNAVKFSNFKCAPEGHVGQWRDMQEVANSNMSMNHAREMMDHRFAEVRQAAHAAFDVHVKMARSQVRGA